MPIPSLEYKQMTLADVAKQIREAQAAEKKHEKQSRPSRPYKAGEKER